MLPSVSESGVVSLLELWETGGRVPVSKRLWAASAVLCLTFVRDPRLQPSRILPSAEEVRSRWKPAAQAPRVGEVELPGVLR